MKQPKLQAYLDDTDLMTIIVDQTYYHHEYQLSIYCNREPVEFYKCTENLYNKVYKLTLRVDQAVCLRDDWKVTLDESIEAEVLSGQVVRTKTFIENNHYHDSDLGFVYQAKQTQFKLWAPIAKKVHLLLESPKGDKTTHELEYDKKGVWQIRIDEDLEHYAYLYNVYVNGGWKKVKDPYAIASKANGQAAYVIDIDRTYEMKHGFHTPDDLIIYELSVRDFSSDQGVAFKHPKEYLALIEEGHKTQANHPIGFDYLKELGISHIQLMPVYDFTGVDEDQPDKSYNWGYNPSQYFVPEGSYSSKANDAYQRINELKQVIDTYHQHGMGVIMDVVYNHVDHFKRFPYEILVPGYAYRVDDKDMMTNFSGCGNDLNTQMPMIRKLIIDSLIHWTQMYGMDGYRFDLMGLIDVQTMNEVAKVLQAIKPDILLYGEGWRMDDDDALAHMDNQEVCQCIGFFNDQFRDHIKGSTFNLLDKGFALGDLSEQAIIDAIFKGQSKLPTHQSINYIECHDNHTFYDKAMVIFEDEAIAQKRQLLATCLTIIAPGLPFIHFGQEFYRSKDGVGNSYNVSDEINRVVWSDIDLYQEDIQVVKAFIHLKKTLNHDNIESIEWFDSGFDLLSDSYHIRVIVKENSLDMTEISLPLILSTDTKRHPETNTIGIYVYERK